jgi:hypothetical protein
MRTRRLLVLLAVAAVLAATLALPAGAATDGGYAFKLYSGGQWAADQHRQDDADSTLSGLVIIRDDGRLLFEGSLTNADVGVYTLAIGIEGACAPSNTPLFDIDVGAEPGVATFNWTGVPTLPVGYNFIRVYPKGGACQTRWSTVIPGSETVPPATMSCPDGQTFVNSVGTSAVSVPANVGFDYLVTASGSYYAGGEYQYDIQADAEYSQDAYQRVFGEAWTDDVRGYTGYGEGLLELKVDGDFVEWGPYSALHTYTITQPAVDPLMQFEFQIYDLAGGSNNTGGLCVSLDQIPEGEITAPDEGEVVFDSLYLEALYYDDNPDGVQWAVRKGTCAAGTGTVAGNVDGFHDSYSWNGHTFSSTLDSSVWATGAYCWVFNPGEGPGEPNMRLTREFFIGDFGALSPDIAYNPVGSDHTVTVGLGEGVEGIEVLFDIDGPNYQQSGTELTDADGVASFTWTGTYPGTDVVTACLDLDDNGSCDVGEPAATGTATKYWMDFGAVSPAMAYNPMGSDHTVTVDIGVPVADVPVLFEVSGVNPTSGSEMTNAAGVASFTWTGTNPGTDTVTACFDANSSGSCDAGEMFASSDATKKWWDVSINGGGQILQADPADSRGKNPFKISFGGYLYQLGSEGLECEWQVNFHNVSNDVYDKAVFHATSCSDLDDTFDPLEADGVVNFKAHGTLNGVAGYTILFRMEDFTEPSVMDTIRMEVYQGSTRIYDTSPDVSNVANAVHFPDDAYGGDFDDESTIFGGNRTFLDNGNIQIWDLN